MRFIWVALTLWFHFIAPSCFVSLYTRHHCTHTHSHTHEHKHRTNTCNAYQNVRNNEIIIWPIAAICKMILDGMWTKRQPVISQLAYLIVARQSKSITIAFYCLHHILAINLKIKWILEFFNGVNLTVVKAKKCFLCLCVGKIQKCKQCNISFRFGWYHIA